MSANAAGLPLPQSRLGLRFPLVSRNPGHELETPDAGLSPNLDDLLAPVRWLPSPHADPELRKVLGAIQTHLS
jgi:hypothetical protein